MKFIIAAGTNQVEYNSSAFWLEYDEVEVEEPQGWYIRYVEGGIVHSFDYCQSSGRGEYTSRYTEDVYKKPLAFTKDSKENARIMQSANYDGKKAVLIREPQE